MSVVPVLKTFVDALNLEKLRLGAPRRFVFFCGGKIAEPKQQPSSIRDLLLRKLKGTDANLDAHFVLAESATSLYRDSKYHDLIGFEADVAQIADIVLLVGESPGSLTELGAFSMNEHIAPRLKILIQSEYYNGAESFIRNGPIRYLENKYPGSVCPYPWKTKAKGKGKGKLEIATAIPEVPNMCQDIKNWLDKISARETLNRDNPRHRMLIIYWILYVLRGATLGEIVDCLQLYELDISADDVHRALYCMRVAQWVDENTYGHFTYYIAKKDEDPFEYAFKATTNTREAVRQKADLGSNLRLTIDERPKQIRELAGRG